jgi:hypothetical protein
VQCSQTLWLSIETGVNVILEHLLELGIRFDVNKLEEHRLEKKSFAS